MNTPHEAGVDGRGRDAASEPDILYRTQPESPQEGNVDPAPASPVVTWQELSDIVDKIIETGGDAMGELALRERQDRAADIAAVRAELAEMRGKIDAVLILIGSADPARAAEMRAKLSNGGGAAVGS